MASRQVRVTPAGSEVAAALLEMQEKGLLRYETPNFSITLMSDDRGLTFAQIRRTLKSTRQTDKGSR